MGVADFKNRKARPISYVDQYGIAALTSRNKDCYWS
jgi:hypothetical protein